MPHQIVCDRNDDLPKSLCESGERFGERLGVSPPSLSSESWTESALDGLGGLTPNRSPL